MKKEVWIKCKLVEGLFEGEKIVLVATPDIVVSFFLDDLSYLQIEDGGQDLLRVVLLDQDSECSLIRLPRESIESGHIVKIKNTEIVQTLPNFVEDLDSALEKIRINIEIQKRKIEILQLKMKEDAKTVNFYCIILGIGAVFLSLLFIFG
jgi:hypothetical protein